MEGVESIDGLSKAGQLWGGLAITICRPANHIGEKMRKLLVPATVAVPDPTRAMTVPAAPTVAVTAMGVTMGVTMGMAVGMAHGMADEMPDMALAPSGICLTGKTNRAQSDCPNDSECNCGCLHDNVLSIISLGLR